ncbi:MAG: two-component sensor histidine kinase [Gammaproteobacteria bacterium]|nr:two-component sensor histidine kinase [Gammaproteobacteria bacterium]
MNTMFRSLYSKFTVIIFFMFVVLAGLLAYLHLYSTHMYQQETQQKISKGLAEHIAKKYKLVENGMIYNDRLDYLFHEFMQLNPSIEIYALDPAGKIVRFNIPKEKVIRKNIDLDPVKAYVNGKAEYPIKGNDPRDVNANKIFSVAPLMDGDSLIGYLYIILEGERYGNIVDRLMDNYIAKISTWVIVAVIIFSMLCALLLFKYMTRRMSVLSNNIEIFRQSRFSMLPPPVTKDIKYADEIDKLTVSFYDMANRIISQVNELKQIDIHRRELIANVSHDLRTPLTTLQGYLETLLRKNHELNDQQKEQYLKTAVNHCQNLATLIAELFELAKLDANETQPKLEAFSLPELIHDTMQNFWLLSSQRHISMQTHFDNNIPFVKADLGLIERVIRNLIENAIRYTPDGGQIDIQLVENKDSVTVQIRDNGCGIAEKELPMIFDRFYRTEKSRQESSGGSGLGLAISKRIIELHGSHIQAFSKINEGTVFRFNLPVVHTG